MELPYLVKFSLSWGGLQGREHAKNGGGRCGSYKPSQWPWKSMTWAWMSLSLPKSKEEVRLKEKSLRPALPTEGQAGWQGDWVEERQWAAVSCAGAYLRWKETIHLKNVKSPEICTSLGTYRASPQAICRPSVCIENGMEDKEFYKLSI